MIPAIQTMQASMAFVANKMQRIGKAWAALGANKLQNTAPPAVPLASGIIRKFDEKE
ncbi:MAG: hypothetical protein AB2693_26595 [Candidatus Thiodiazotropha sp.]